MGNLSRMAAPLVVSALMAGPGCVHRVDPNTLAEMQTDAEFSDAVVARGTNTDSTRMTPSPRPFERATVGSDDLITLPRNSYNATMMRALAASLSGAVVDHCGVSNPTENTPNRSGVDVSMSFTTSLEGQEGAGRCIGTQIEANSLTPWRM